MKQLITLFAVLAFAMAACAQSLPSSKATAQVNALVKCTMTAVETPDDDILLPASCVDIFSGQAVDAGTNGWIKIMEKPLKVSASQSIFVSPSLVTGLYTRTRTKTTTPTLPDTLNTSEAVAMGGVYLRAQVVDEADNVVAVGAPLSLCTGDPAPYGCVKPGADDDWGVILNSRVQTLSQSLSNCVVDVQVGETVYTGSCSFTSIIDLILNTTSAHTFNFIFENLGANQGSGIYKIQILAAVASGAEVTEGSSGAAVGAAVFGLGSMTAEKVRLVHGFEF